MNQFMLLINLPCIFRNINLIWNKINSALALLLGKTFYVLIKSVYFIKLYFDTSFKHSQLRFYTECINNSDLYLIYENDTWEMSILKNLIA